MQEYLQLAVTGYMVAGVVVGFGLGYFIGDLRSLKPLDRVILGVIVSTIGGILVGLVLGEFIPPESISFLITVVSSLAGCAFGEMIRWAPSPPKPPKKHVIYEADDDDAFDREIEETLGGSK